MTPARFALVALLAFAAAPARADEPADGIKGIWAVDSLTFDGTKVPDDPTAGPMLTAFDGRQYVQRKGQTITEEGSYETDPTKSPRTIDFVIKKGDEAGKRQLGIYEVEGNTLRLCLAEPGSRKRPASFAAPRTLVVVNTRYRP